jgi:hypothetical protein
MGPIIDQPETGCLLIPSKDDLVIDFIKLGFEVMG